MLAERGRITTVKTRYIAETQQFLRADREHVAPLTGRSARRSVKIVAPCVAALQVAIVSDYAKGVLANGARAEIIEAARGRGPP